MTERFQAPPGPLLWWVEWISDTKFAPGVREVTWELRGVVASTAFEAHAKSDCPLPFSADGLKVEVGDAG